MKSKNAHWKPVPYTGLHKRTQRKAVILHTNGGGSGSLHGYFTGNAQGSHGADNRHVGAHFQVLKDGSAEQYVDTDHVIYHAYSGSEFAVGIETEDDGHPSKPWTAAQVKTIVAICKELGVPARLLKATASDGVGWHEQHSAWNKTAHSCPGAVREKQIRKAVIPALKPPKKKTAKKTAHKPKPAPKPPAKKAPVIGVTRAWLIDTTERAVSTFAETFAAAFGVKGLTDLAGQHWADALTVAHTAETAALAAAVAVVKAAFAAKRKGTVSPASVVKK